MYKLEYIVAYARMASVVTFSSQNSRRSTMIIAYQFFALSLALAIGTALFFMPITGKRLSLARKHVAQIRSVTHVNYVTAQVELFAAGQAHKKNANWLFGLTLLLVVSIVAKIALFGRSERDVLSHIHLAFALLYFIPLVVMYFWYDGTHLYHKEVAYFVMVCYAIMTPIGIQKLFTYF